MEIWNNTSPNNHNTEVKFFTLRIRNFNWPKNLKYCLLSRNSKTFVSIDILKSQNNWRKHNQHFKVHFSIKCTLWHIKLNICTIYGKLNLLWTNSIYLVFPSQGIQRKLMETNNTWKRILQTFFTRPEKKRLGNLHK